MKPFNKTKHGPSITADEPVYYACSTISDDGTYDKDEVIEEFRNFLKKIGRQDHTKMLHEVESWLAAQEHLMPIIHENIERYVEDIRVCKNEIRDLNSEYNCTEDERERLIFKADIRQQNSYIRFNREMIKRLRDQAETHKKYRKITFAFHINKLLHDQNPTGD